MRLIDYLDELGWTQSRFSQESRVSPTTLRRILQGTTIQRQTAEDICKTLSTALGRPIKIRDVNELHIQAAERPERRKQDGDQHAD